MFTHALPIDEASELLDRLDAERVARRVQGAVSEIPISELVSTASRTAGAITDHLAGFNPRRRHRRSRRALVVGIVAVVAVAVAVVVVRRQRSGDASGPDVQRRPGAANPN